MALVNFTTPFGNILPAHSWTTISPLQRHATAINNMLYGPAGHQQQNEDDPDYDYDYKNEPYAPPTIKRPQQTLYQTPPLTQPQQQQQPHQYRRANDYLPPPTPRNSQSRQPPQHFQQPHLNNINSPDYPSSPYTTRSFGSSLEQQQQQQRKLSLPQQKPLQPPLKEPQYNERYDQNEYNVRRVTSNYPQQSQGTSSIEQPTNHITSPSRSTFAPPTPSANVRNNQPRGNFGSTGPSRDHRIEDVETDLPTTSAQHGGDFPSQAPTFTRVRAGTGSNTNVHAVLDYDEEDDDDYYDANDNPQGGKYYTFEF